MVLVRGLLGASLRRRLSAEHCETSVSLLRCIDFCCRGLVSVGACCVELFVLCRGLRGAFELLLSAPTCCGPCALVWNTCTRCSVTLFLLLPVLVKAVLCTFPAPSVGDFSRDSFVLSQRGSDVFDVAVASPRLLLAPPFVEASSPRMCLAHFAVSPAVGVSRAAQTFYAWLVLLSRRDVLLVLDLVLRSVDGEFDVELGTVRVPLEMSSQQLLVHKLPL